MSERVQIELEGMVLVCEPISHNAENMKPGDTYIGKRNSIWKMGTFKFVKNDCVYAEENVYPFHVGECLKVLEMRVQ